MVFSQALRYYLLQRRYFVHFLLPSGRETTAHVAFIVHIKVVILFALVGGASSTKRTGNLRPYRVGCAQFACGAKLHLTAP